MFMARATMSKEVHEWKIHSIHPISYLKFESLLLFDCVLLDSLELGFASLKVGTEIARDTERITPYEGEGGVGLRP
jgi:hypothetical protein